MDSSFIGPIQARTLGSNVYSGPGINHQFIGKLEKNGIITVTAKT